MFADLGLSEPEARDVVTDVDKALAGGVPSEETRGSWRVEASEALRRQYGVNAGKVLAEAQKFIARDPRLAAWLAATGFGDHPKIIALAIQKSRR